MQLNDCPALARWLSCHAQTSGYGAPGSSATVPGRAGCRRSAVRQLAAALSRELAHGPASPATVHRSAASLLARAKAVANYRTPDRFARIFMRTSTEKWNYRLKTSGPVPFFAALPHLRPGRVPHGSPRVA